MVNWFTFLENQPDVDHEKHQRGKASRVERCSAESLRPTNNQIQHKDAAAASHPLDCNPLPRWGGPVPGAFFVGAWGGVKHVRSALEGRFT